IAEGRQSHVRQTIAATSDERLTPQLGLEVLDATAGLKQHRLIDEGQWRSEIAVFRERFCKRVRQPGRIDENVLNPDIDQMIEREGNQRLAKNRQERLW